MRGGGKEVGGGQGVEGRGGSHVWRVWGPTLSDLFV